MVEHKPSDAHTDHDDQNLSLDSALKGEAPHILAALYKFVRLEDFEELKPKLLTEMKRLDIKGSLLLAKEGINGTISGSREQLSQFLTFLKSDPDLRTCPIKNPMHSKHHFIGLK